MFIIQQDEVQVLDDYDDVVDDEIDDKNEQVLAMTDVMLQLIEVDDDELQTRDIVVELDELDVNE